MPNIHFVKQEIYGEKIFKNAVTFDTDITVGTTPTLFVDVSLDRVGIGTSGPLANAHIKSGQFTVAHTTKEGILLESDTFSSGTFSPSIGFGYSGAIDAAIAGVYETADNNQMGLAFFVHPDAVGGNDKIEAARIDKDGNVGINTSSPDTKLQVVGISRFGEDVTNYAEFEADGTLELNGDATVYEDLQVGISNIRIPVSNAPADQLYAFGIVDGVTYPVKGFAVDEYIYFDAQTSHSMKLNEVLDNHIHFTLPDTTDIGDNFQFQLDCIAAGIDTQWAVPSGSPYTSERAVAANDNTFHRLMEIADIAASNDTVSTVYHCKLTRIAATADEYAGEVYLSFTDCHYKKDGMGSRLETSK